MAVTSPARLSDLSIKRALTPDLLWRRYAERRAERNELQVLDWILGADERRLAWLHSIGVAGDPELAALVPPLPPRALRQIVAAADDADFLWTGFVDLCTVLARFEQYRRDDLLAPHRVLDFGAGCGRTSRFLALAAHRWSTTASDVNLDHVAWCQRALPAVRSIRNAADPPLPVAAESQDLVFSLSVFSHLRDDRARAWLADVARVLRPGGLLVITTHGPTALHVIEHSVVHQEMFGLSVEETRAITGRLAVEGTVYLPYGSAVVKVAKAGPEYGNCFVSSEHVRTAWGAPYFEVITVEPGGLRSWQDVVVLRRR
jgi:SAM-dependent methyltransferase